MILETHQALATTLKAKVLGTSGVAIAFETPGKPWITSLKAPTVNFFLFDIRENTNRREVMYEEVRDANGVVVSRRIAPPRFDLFYTVSVWAPKITVEHQVLAVALRYFASLVVIPREHLPPALAALPYEVLVSTAAGSKRGMFLNLGGEQKVGFELTVTVPMPPLGATPAAPPVRQPPQVNVTPVPGADPARTVAATETVSANRPAAPATPSAPGTTRAPSSDPDGSSSGGGADATAPTRSST